MTTTDPTALAEQIAREHEPTTYLSAHIGCSCQPRRHRPWGHSGFVQHIATVTEQAVREQMQAVAGQGVTAEQAWDEGLRAGEAVERSRWQWSAGATARAVNGLTERPERPANPYRAARIARGGTHA